MNVRTLAVFLSLLALASAVFARPGDEARRAELGAMTNRLKYQTGVIHLRDGLATIHLKDSFKYLDTAGTETLLTGIWGNPPSRNKVLGTIVPADFDPLGSQAWCVIVSYQEDGYIKDDDAEKIDYTELLKEMQEGTKEANTERLKNGYPAIELVGWASPPHYDKATHKFYWAKELRFGDHAEETTLNYGLRVLGRRGVLELNAVASTSQLAVIEKATPTILEMVEFDPGARYSDFTPRTDKVATYGLAALVAGGIAAKTGLLKGLFVALIALKKFVIVGVLALGAFFKRMFTKNAGSSN